MSEESDIHLTSGNIHTNEAHKNNNCNNIMPVFRGLNKTRQKITDATRRK
jgi:hypothetical protein